MTTLIDTLVGQQAQLHNIEKLRKARDHAHTGPYRVELDTNTRGAHMVLWRPTEDEAKSWGRECFRGPRDDCAEVCSVMNRGAMEVADRALAEAEAKLREVLTTAMIGGAS